VSATTEPKRAPRSPSDAAIADFLNRHPDILFNRPEILAHLAGNEQPGAGNVRDFQTALIQRMRNDLVRRDGLIEEVAAAARDNLIAMRRVHDSVLAIVQARGFETLVKTVTGNLAGRLGLLAVTICLEDPDIRDPKPAARGIHALPLGSVDRLIGPGTMALLRPEATETLMLYGGPGTKIQSDALIRLNVSPRAPTGLLCLGAGEPRSFTPEQGTDLVSFLGRVLEAQLRAWLDLPETE